MKKKDLAWILNLSLDQMTVITLQFKDQTILLSADNERSYFEKEYSLQTESDCSFTFSLPTFHQFLSAVNGRSSFALTPQGLCLLTKEGEIKEILEYPPQIEERHFHTVFYQNVPPTQISVSDWAIHNKFRLSIDEYPECDKVYVFIDEGVLSLMSTNGTAFCRTQVYSAGFEAVENKTFTIEPDDLELLSGFFPDDQLIMFNLQQQGNEADLILIDESLENNGKMILHLNEAAPQRVFSAEVLEVLDDPERNKKIIDLSKVSLKDYKKENSENRSCSSKSSSKSYDFSVEMINDQLEFNCSKKRISLNTPQCVGIHCFINSYDMAQILAFQPLILSENKNCIHWCRNETAISILKNAVS